MDFLRWMKWECRRFLATGVGFGSDPELWPSGLSSQAENVKGGEQAMLEESSILREPTSLKTAASSRGKGSAEV